MLNTTDNTGAKKKKRASFLSKVMIPMIFLGLLQIVIFVTVLTVSGEFSLIRKFSYNSLTEKTENRKNYVETTLNQKTSLVYETAQEINQITAGILKEENQPITDIQTDKSLTKHMLSAYAERLINLIRRDMVNDAFIILETGSLYDEGGCAQRTGLYMRDTDINQNSTTDNSDIYMEMGSSEVAHALGLALDFEWSLCMDVTDSTNPDLTFYFDTLKAGGENPDIPLYNLGRWTGLSKISDSASKSMKYTLPLVTEDGHVYGVIGIGLLEKTILKAIPTNDFFNESACYILAQDMDESGVYEQILHAGPAYSRLVKEQTVLNGNRKETYGLLDFSSDASPDCIGSIQEMNLYNSSSPYKSEKWALISVADKSKILSMYTTVLKTFFISLSITLICSLILSVIISNGLSSPVTKMVKVLDSNRRTNEILTFKSSGIAEIDLLASSIVDLQMDIMEYASRVSRIILLSDSGIGVFMADCRTNTVFVGESLIKLLQFTELPEKDVTISADAFREQLSRIDNENVILNLSIFKDPVKNEKHSSESREIRYQNPADNSCRWFKFNLTRDNSNVMCLVQDITNVVVEKKKIEYERDYDITTGLLNRRAFYRTIDLLFSHPEKLKTAAFVMLDLDNLKYVNDTYGHDFGDDYIKTAANVLKSVQADGYVSARLSGDEFIFFIYGYDTRDEIRTIIDRFKHSLRVSYCILSDGTHYKIRASGGISWYPDDANSYGILIKYADFAMYKIKHSTKGNIAEFDISSYNHDAILMTGVEEMNRIIDENSVKYAFQSIISARTGEIFGYEALMRPQSSVFNSPLEFIRIAKSSAKLYEIEKLTWLRGLADYRVQVEKENISPKAKLFINSISNYSLSQEIQEQITKENTGFLQNVVLEILESEQSNEVCIQKKKEMIKRWNGIVALDDFGTGYNSEYALITLDPDLIKIDRSLINGCDKDISRENIIRNITQMSHKNHILVLAEGVETYNEMKKVIECGVDLIQGFYLSRPLFEPLPLDQKFVEEIRALQYKK